MCEYCSGEKAYDEWNEVDVIDVRISDGQLCIEIEAGNRDWRYYENFKLNYCPNCGKEL